MDDVDLTQLSGPELREKATKHETTIERLLADNRKTSDQAAEGHIGQAKACYAELKRRLDSSGG